MVIHLLLAKEDGDGGVIEGYMTPCIPLQVCPVVVSFTGISRIFDAVAGNWSATDARGRMPI